MAKDQKMGDGKRPMKNPPSQTSDLNLVLNGDTLTTSLSERAKWAGIEKKANQTDDASVSLTNKLFVGARPGSLSAKAQGRGFYRGWTTDDDYTVHTSNWVHIR